MNTEFFGEMCEYTRYLFDHFSAKIHDLIRIRGLSDTCYYLMSIYEMYAKAFSGFCGSKNSAEWNKAELPWTWNISYSK